MPTVLTISRCLDAEKLEDAFDQMIARHEILRTVFEATDGDFFQKVLSQEEASKEFSILKADGGERATALAEIRRRFVRPFDLERGPLIRMALVETAPDGCQLLLDMHHIISDGVSVSIFLRELFALYGGEALPELSIS